jgi:hypothetical protein
VKISPTPLTAALAGIFSALAWPLLFVRFGGSVEVVVITLLVIALPAHAFVVGFERDPAAGRTLDTALLKRIGVWIVAAGGSALLVMAVRSYLGSGAA